MEGRATPYEVLVQGAEYAYCRNGAGGGRVSGTAAQGPRHPIDGMDAAVTPEAGWFRVWRFAACDSGEDT